MVSMANAEDNGKPEVKAWFTWMEENGTWHEWIESTEENRGILYNVELKIGQPIKCKIEITPKYDASVGSHLFPAGTTIPYDPINGKGMYDIVDFKPVYANQTVSYTWVLKPNGNLTGHAPINCYWEVNYATYVDREEDYGSFAFANPIILAEEWQGKEDIGNEGSEGGNGGIPGFEALFAVAGVIAAYVMVRRRNE